MPTYWNKYPKFTFRADADTLEKLRVIAEKDKSTKGRILRALIETAYIQAITPPKEKAE